MGQRLKHNWTGAGNFISVCRVIEKGEKQKERKLVLVVACFGSKHWTHNVRGKGGKQELAALGLGLLLATDALSLVAAGGLALGSLGLMGEGKVWGYKFFN